VATPRDEPVAGERDAPESIANFTLLERVLTRANLQRALKQVRQNQGAPGIDGMSVDELPEYLRHHWLEIRAQLVAGRYRPQPVRRVEIPKPDGRKRLLGIPTVLDRFIQQAIAQVVQVQWEPHFHRRSYGFRPQRSAHQAVRQLQVDIREGRRWVVDLDLEAFFDRVNHDRLVARLRRHVPDRTLLRLINRYLKAGVRVGEEIEATTRGVPQGGPLSPVLANVVLDELDWELDRRGHRFARYADDCNIVVGSARAGVRVMASVKRFIEGSTRAHSEYEKERGGSPVESQVPGLHGQSQRSQAQGGRSGHRKAQGANTRADPSYERSPMVGRRGRAERNPAWLESVFRHCRSAESSARHRQMDTTQITLLPLEAMGPGGIPGTATTRSERARGMAHQQVGARTVAPVENPSACAGTPSAILSQFGAAEFGSEITIQFIEPPCT